MQNGNAVDEQGITHIPREKLDQCPVCRFANQSSLKWQRWSAYWTAPEIVMNMIE